MKCFLILGFLPLLALFSPENGEGTGFAPPGSIPDTTVTVNSTGQNNRVVIDSLCLENAFYNDTLAASVTGKITQTGQNNSIEINTKRETPNNKQQISNKNQKTNSKTQNPSDQCPMTSDKEPVPPGQHIKITQTGKNNSVKINSR